MSRRHHSHSREADDDDVKASGRESRHRDGEKHRSKRGQAEAREGEGRTEKDGRNLHDDDIKMEPRKRDRSSEAVDAAKTSRDERKRTDGSRDRDLENGRRRERPNTSDSDTGKKLSNGEVHKNNDRTENRTKRSPEDAGRERRNERSRRDDVERGEERKHADRERLENTPEEKRDRSRDTRPARDASTERNRLSDKLSSPDKTRERRREDDDGTADRRRDDRGKTENADRRERERDGRLDRERGQEDRREGRRNEEDRKRDDRQRPRRDDNAKQPIEDVEDNEDASYLKAKRAKIDDTLATRTGGAYIPPARLRMMQEQISDKASLQYQRMSWEALKKSINGLINKANVSNLVHVVRELFQENIVRGRGLLVRSLMQAQAASPTFTHVYAALVAVINTKFPQIGELVVKRLIINFRKGYRRNDKNLCGSASRFIAHLVNQKVAHEVLSLEVLHVLLENPSNDSVELAIGFLKECGQRLTEVSPKGVTAVFERLRVILHEAQIDKRVQYMIEVMYAIRKDGFKDHPAVVDELDIVEEDDQVTHMLALENGDNPEDGLNVFKIDPNFLENEEKYRELKKEILGESSSDEEGDGSGSEGESDDEESDEEAEKKDAIAAVIVDSTETNLIALRRTIYLTIQSSLDFEECAHKLIKMQLKPGQEDELCSMILDCCAQQRTFEKFYGLLAQRFCMIDRKYVAPFQRMFGDQYNFIHRLETNKLRNIAKLFAHLLHTDAISWEVLQCIKLNEDDTTSSSRIFIKILFQELCEFLGLTKLNNRLKDVTLQPFFEGLFPRDNPRNTRFSINFFTSIGLGGLTDELRAHLKSMPKQTPVVLSKSSSSDASSSSDDSSSDSDDSSSSDSSDEEKVAVRPTKLSQFLNAQLKKSKNLQHESEDDEKRMAAKEDGSRHRKKAVDDASGGHHKSREATKTKAAGSDDDQRKSRHKSDPKKSHAESSSDRKRSKGDTASDGEHRKSRHGSDHHRRSKGNAGSDEENRHKNRSDISGSGIWPKTREDEEREKAAMIRSREQDLERAQRRLLELANYGTTEPTSNERAGADDRATAKKRKHQREEASASPPPRKEKKRHSRSPGRKRR